VLAVLGIGEQPRLVGFDNEGKWACTAPQGWDINCCLSESNLDIKLNTYHYEPHHQDEPPYMVTAYGEKICSFTDDKELPTGCDAILTPPNPGDFFAPPSSPFENVIEFAGYARIKDYVVVDVEIPPDVNSDNIVSHLFLANTCEKGQRKSRLYASDDPFQTFFDDQTCPETSYVIYLPGYRDGVSQPYYIYLPNEFNTIDGKIKGSADCCRAGPDEDLDCIPEFHPDNDFLVHGFDWSGEWVQVSPLGGQQRCWLPQSAVGASIQPYGCRFGNFGNQDFGNFIPGRDIVDFSGPHQGYCIRLDQDGIQETPPGTGSLCQQDCGWFDLRDYTPKDYPPLYYHPYHTVPDADLQLNLAHSDGPPLTDFTASRHGNFIYSFWTNQPGQESTLIISRTCQDGNIVWDAIKINGNSWSAYDQQGVPGCSEYSVVDIYAYYGDGYSQAVQHNLDQVPQGELVGIINKERVHGRWGDSQAFLHKYELNLGAELVIKGMNYSGTWLWVQPRGYESGGCWVSRNLVDLPENFDINAIPIVSVQYPETQHAPTPKGLNVTRKGDQVTVTWKPSDIDSGDFMGYFIEVICIRDGALVRFPASSLNDPPKFTFKCDPGTSVNVFVRNVHSWGYSKPVEWEGNP
jgi:hypothetical protein